MNRAAHRPPAQRSSSTKSETEAAKEGVEPLQLIELSVRFGGVQALDHVSLSVPPAAIVGLIGPNGAGKTTLFNCVTGLQRPNAGRVLLFGDDVTGWPPHRRARYGVGRTFQRLELFSSLTVLENLVIAHESTHARGLLLSDLLSLPPSLETRSQATEQARAILGDLGLARYEGTRAGDLPIGLARLVELGRALLTTPRLLLLDEPSSGLRARESHNLTGYLRRARDERAMSILVVEHDMKFVLGLCDYVFVLDFGRLLAEGPPADIRANRAVQAAYLGQEVDDGAAARR
jgi:branched-chain amino acid transport system ATP-binding protein